MELFSFALALFLLVPAQESDELIAALGNDSAEVRENASRELLRRAIASPDAAALLERAILRASDPEIRARLRDLSRRADVARNEPRLVPHGVLAVPAGARSTAISPDGSRIATMGWDRTLRVWEFESLRPAAAAELEERRADAEVQFTPDGGRIVVSTPEEIVFVDARTLQPEAVIAGGTRSIHLVPAVHPDGKAVAYARSRPDGLELVVADLNGAEVTRAYSWSGWPNGVPRHVSFSRDGRKLVCVEGDRVNVLETRSLRLLEAFEEKSVFQAAFSEEDAYLVTVSTKNEVVLRTPKADASAGSLPADPAVATVLDRTFVRMKDRLLVAQGADRSLLVAVWMPGRKEFFRSPSRGEGTVFSPSVSADGTRLVFSTRQEPGRVQLHRLAIGRP